MPTRLATSTRQCWSLGGMPALRKLFLVRQREARERETRHDSKTLRNPETRLPSYTKHANYYHVPTSSYTCLACPFDAAASSCKAHLLGCHEL